MPTMSVLYYYAFVISLSCLIVYACAMPTIVVLCILWLCILCLGILCLRLCLCYAYYACLVLLLVLRQFYGGFVLGFEGLRLDQGCKLELKSSAFFSELEFSLELENKNPTRSQPCFKLVINFNSGCVKYVYIVKHWLRATKLLYF